jgi:hypothetical protein
MAGSLKTASVYLNGVLLAETEFANDPNTTDKRIFTIPELFRLSQVRAPG